MAAPLELDATPTLELQTYKIEEKETTIELTTVSVEVKSEPAKASTTGSVQNLYISWSQTRPSPEPFDPEKPPIREWRDHAAEAWLEANRNNFADYERYCLAQFIQCCAVYDADQFRYVDENCQPRSPLRRFTEYWVAWNQHLTGSRTTKWAGLPAAWSSIWMLRTSEDPRPFDLQHWYEPCGDDFAPRCEHVPSVREANREKVARPAKPEVVVRGRSLEIQARNAAASQAVVPQPAPVSTLPPWQAAPTQTSPQKTISKHGVCSKLLWTLIFLTTWLWMTAVAGLISTKVLSTGLNLRMVRYNGVLCIWAAVVFILILIRRSKARRYFWFYFVPWIPAFIMVAVDSRQCTAWYDNSECAPGGALAAGTFLNAVAMYFFARIWHRY